jgi:actin-related protein
LLVHKVRGRRIAVEIKENLGYTDLNFETEMERARRTTDLDHWFVLPDMPGIVISHEHFRCRELAFKSNLGGFDFECVDQIDFDSIMKSDDSFVKDRLFEIIVLSRGTKMLSGFLQRFNHS